jgi:8-oxo-dGTP diphosphatase
MKEYKNEQEFLSDYDPTIFDRPSVTVDILIISVSSKDIDNYRKLSNKIMSVLLIKRDNYPFKDKYCLPGGFIKMDESLDESAKRILKHETNIDDIYIEQLYTFSDPNRDPRTRVISTSYVALIDKNRLVNNLNTNTSWFDIQIDNNNYTLTNELDTINFTIQDNQILNNQKLAFDHPLVIDTGLNRIKNKIEYTDIVFNMMPEEFTLGELQQVYEVILNKKLLDPAFRRIIANKVVKTNNYQKGGGHRPSILFRYKK